MAETLQNRLGVIEALDDLARAFLKVSDVLHDCARELSDQLAEDCTETKELAEIKPLEDAPVKKKVAKPRTLPGRSGLFDTKRMRIGIKIKFLSRSRPTEFADMKQFGKYLTGMTPDYRLFTLPKHIDTADSYIQLVKDAVVKLVEKHRPELGEVEWVEKVTSDGRHLRA